MTKEEITKEIGKKILRPIEYSYLLLLLVFISSFFIWIWHSWDLAWKIGLTGIVGMVFIYWVHKIAKESISKTVEEEMQKPVDTEKKSRFLQRLEEMQKLNSNLNK